MKTWTLIDTETDGLCPPIHVIEIAAQKFEGLKPIGTPFQIYINPGVKIPAEATAVHGYTTDFIELNGVTPEEAYMRLSAYIGDDSVVAHYLAFDWDRVLIPELFRLRKRPIGRRGFCSWLLARRALPEHPTHKLDYLRDSHSLSCSRPHSALGDVESTTDLLTRIIFPRLASIGYGTIERVEEFATLRPLLRCKCLIQGLDYEEEARKVLETKKEQRRLEKFLLEVECGQYPIPSLLIDHDLIEEEANIQFFGRTFLFTGKMAWGTRPEAVALIEERGGFVSKSKTISKEIDYFVLGEDKEKGWTSLIHGGKLTAAFLKRFKEPSFKYKIVREEDFVTALQT